MKVAYAPFTVSADQDRCELSILSDGFRVAMTGEEANALWVEIGTALKQLYADRPEQCPREFAAFLRGQTDGTGVDADTGVDSVNSYAQLPKPSQDDPAERPISSPSEAQRPADTAFRRLVRDTFEKKRRVQ
jgi:hypothetical protein